MKNLMLPMLFVLSLFPSFAESAESTPKEKCGVALPQTRYEIAFHDAYFSQAAVLEFTENGGFTLDDEQGLNTHWIVDAEELRISSSESQNYEIAAFPTQVGRKGPATWASEMNNLLGTIGFIQSHLNGTRAEMTAIKTALNCAHRILIKTVARGQEVLIQESAPRGE